jgi:hypothetical protein
MILIEEIVLSAKFYREERRISSIEGILEHAKGVIKTVFLRWTANTMVQRKKTKGQTIIHKKLCRKN